MDEKLLNYLKQVARLEQDKYTCEAIVEKLNKEINTLEENKYYKKPSERNYNLNYMRKEIGPKVYEKYPEKYMKEKEPKAVEKPASAGNMYLLFCPLFMVALPPGLMVSYGIYLFFKYITDAELSFIIWQLILCSIFFLIGLFMYSHEMEDKKAEYSRFLDDTKKYEEESTAVKYYNEVTRTQLIDNEIEQKLMQIIDNDKKEYERKLQEYNLFCEKADININISKEHLLSISETLENVKKSLEKAYAQNIIYQKYRSLIPVTMICEYIESGACETLGGAFGAYNKYDQELIANIIISKLDDILVSLQDIKENQFMLYNAIQESNHTIERIVTEVKNLGAKQEQLIQQVSDSYQLNKTTSQQMITAETQTQALLAYNNQVAERIHNIQETEFWVR